MRVALTPHPESRSSAVRWIEVEVDRSDSAVLTLRYLLGGSVAGLQIPEYAPSARADRLWQATCFELFLRRPGEESYLEFNFSPSTQWAVYRFAGYREGMCEEPDRLAPRIRLLAARTGLTLEIELRNLPEPPWRVGLSAVIGEADGRKSYWALAHPPGAPDFHHQDCFALELPPAA